MRFKIYFFLYAAVVYASFFALSTPGFAQTPEVKTSGEGLATRVAPGEFLPISIKLVNFGRQRRTDVTIKYQIFAGSGEEIYSETETVAVETTASFVKHIQIPRGISAGNYTAASSLLYEFQEVPAISRFEFTVEPKIFGFFQSDFFLYGGVSFFIGIAGLFLARWFFLSRPRGRIVPHDYSDRPHEERIYYEIISDTIQQMRFRVGDDALELAKNIPDMDIDPNDGKVLLIRKNPSKIVALLVLRYETLFGQRVSFKLRGKHDARREHLEPIEKNVDVVRKYFE